MENLPVDTDPSSPPPLAHFLTGKIKECYLKIPQEWHDLTEEELKEVCYPNIKKDSRAKAVFNMDQKIRTAFWLEYDTAIHQGRTMVMQFIYQKFMAQATFDGLMMNPKRLAWITRPTGDFLVETEDLLNRSTQLYYDIFEIPLMEKICRCHYRCICRIPNKKPSHMKPEDCACHKGCICPEQANTKLIDAFIKMRESLELRAKGSVPQVINQKTLSLQVHSKATPKEVQQLANANKSLEELQREQEHLKQIKQKLLSGTPHSPMEHQEAIEATIVEDLGKDSHE